MPFIEPVPSTIHQLECSVDLCDEHADATTIDADVTEDTPSCNRIHQGVYPITPPGVMKRHTYTETTPEITTEKAAAKEEARSQHRASLQQPVSAAAFSCDTQLPATPEHIGDKLTLAQITHIKSKLSGLTTDSVTTPAILQHAVITSLLDSQQFTGCHPHFAKKLNAITKCFREGRYSPSAVLAQKRQAHDAQSAQHNQQRLGELMHSYRVLCGDIQQLDQLARASSGDDLRAIQATQTQKHNACLALKTTITQLKATIDKKIATSSQATTGLDSPACEVGLSTALSTDCVDKTLGEGIDFHTTRSQSSC